MSTSLCVTPPSCITCQRGLGGHRRVGSRTRVSSTDSEEVCAHFLRVPPAPVGPRDNLGDRACSSQCVPQECCVARCLTLTGAFSLTWTWSYFPVCHLPEALVGGTDRSLLGSYGKTTQIHLPTCYSKL